MKEHRDLVAALLAEAKSCADNEVAFCAEDFPQETELQTGQEVTWVSSTFDGLNLVNVYSVTDLGERPLFLGLSFGDGGVLVGADGPFQSLQETEAQYESPEGWTRV